MKFRNKFGTVISLAGVLTLAACGNMNSPTPTSSSGTEYHSSYSDRDYSEYGVVQSIDFVRQGNAGAGNSGIGIGTIAGGVVGGIVGNQLGAGDGKTAATVLGVAGGAYAGHELEKRNQQQSGAYQFTIRMSNGSYQTLTQTTNADLRVGDRVKIENGVAQRY